MQHNEIKGFTDQSEKNKAFINRNKEIEERVFRIVDEVRAQEEYNHTFTDAANEYLIIGFMLLNRGIFQPQRIELPEDKEPEVLMPPIYVGDAFRDEKDRMVKGENGEELIAQGPHWYVKHEWDNYQRRLKGEPEVPHVPAPVLGDDPAGSGRGE